MIIVSRSFASLKFIRAKNAFLLASVILGALGSSNASAFDWIHKKESGEAVGEGSVGRSKAKGLVGTANTDIQVILPRNRCVPGVFRWHGKTCKGGVIGRGTTYYSKGSGDARAQRLLRDPAWEHGKAPTGEDCFYLKENQEGGATPIPSDNKYFVKFNRTDIGPMSKGGRKMDHWARHIRDKNGRTIKKIPTPVFDLIASGKIPRNRDGLRIHSHAKFEPYNNAEPLWRRPTAGCLKLPVDCVEQLQHDMGKAKWTLSIWEK